MVSKNLPNPTLKEILGLSAPPLEDGLLKIVITEKNIYIKTRKKSKSYTFTQMAALKAGQKQIKWAVSSV